VYSEEVINHLSLPIPFNSGSVRAQRLKDGRFSWTQVPGANFSREGNVNCFVVWAQRTPGGPFIYDGSVTFIGALNRGKNCDLEGGLGAILSCNDESMDGLSVASGDDAMFVLADSDEPGPESSDLHPDEHASPDTDPDGRASPDTDPEHALLDADPAERASPDPDPVGPPGNKANDTRRYEGSVRGRKSTYSVKWRLDIRRLESPHSSLNNTYILQRSNALSNWENGGDGKTHCRVSISQCAESKYWTLMVLWNGISLTGEANAISPFGPLEFEVHGRQSISGTPHIVAMPEKS